MQAQKLPIRPMLNHLDNKKIVSRFNKAALTYDKAAVLQRSVANDLLARLQGIRLQPQRILDLGCGTGHPTACLKAAYPLAEIIGLDQAFGMLKQAQAQITAAKFSKFDYLCGRAESLPFRAHCFELVYSNLMLHWSTDFSATLHELLRVLQPGGLLLFSIVGADTLKELRYAWAQVDDKPHVHLFPDMHDVGDSLLQAGFTDPVMDVDYFTLLFTDIFSLMKELKELGVQNLSIDRHKGLTSKRSLRALIEAYATFLTPTAKLPATWEIIYGHAWKATQEVDKNKQGGNEIQISVQEIGGRKKS